MRPPAPAPRSRRTRALLIGAVLTGTAALSACQLPDVSMSPSAADTATTAATTTRAASPSPTAEVEAVQAVSTPTATTPTVAPRPAGELDPGSVTHAVAAGDRQLVVDWWTTGSPTTWTAAEEKTVQLSAHLEGGDDSRIEVLVTRFSAVLDDGTSRTSLSDDRGEFALQAPYTYGTALTLPASAPGATSATVSLQFDLLVETEPGSQRYFRQTVLDSLVLPFTAAQESE
ncbi:hypothetical protein SAMN03159343_2027 [Klenkia marina]|uniref:Uncharacterized protein n=1 Tax=Klenkia marina TaxID=1960309 RepID=A0A1G4Y5R6_9ACTN|nr:hypothetical protein [Klenkia marina]SCX48719.1 hypothetical protein SAMN03159343_2027 [Klenkia marina]